MIDKLTWLIKNAHNAVPSDYTVEEYAEFVASFVLANGVIVLPCKVGDTVWFITGIYGNIVKNAKIVEIFYNGVDFSISVENENGTVFCLEEHEYYLSREEAEAALEGVRE